jgi:hypothetical protein
MAVLCFASSCISAERKFSVSGRIFDAATEKASVKVRVMLLKVGESGLMELPKIEASGETTTDSSGSFTFQVVAKRGVLLEVFLQGSEAPDRYTVPLDKIKDGKLRVEIRIVGGKTEVRWNDEDWVKWSKIEPEKPSR